MIRTFFLLSVLFLSMSCFNAERTNVDLQSSSGAGGLTGNMAILDAATGGSISEALGIKSGPSASGSGVSGGCTSGIWDNSSCTWDSATWAP